MSTTGRKFNQGVIELLYRVSSEPLKSVQGIRGSDYETRASLIPITEFESPIHFLATVKAPPRVETFDQRWAAGLIRETIQDYSPGTAAEGVDPDLMFLKGESMSWQDMKSDEGVSLDLREYDIINAYFANDKGGQYRGSYLVLKLRDKGKINLRRINHLLSKTTSPEEAIGTDFGLLTIPVFPFLTAGMGYLNEGFASNYPSE